MSIVDNITLAMISLKEGLQDYLKEQGWYSRSFKTNILLADDPNIKNKEIVLKVTNERTQIGLPLIIIESGTVTHEIIELGAESGQDYVSLSLYVVGADNQQTLTLGNLIRRKIDGLVLTVYDYTGSKKTSLGSVVFGNTVLDDISNWNSEAVIQRNVNLVTTTMEITSLSFI